MRKFKYLFVLVASLIFFMGCLKNSPQIAGPTGTTGTTGAQGGDLQPITTYTTITSNNLSGLGPLYTFTWEFSAYNPKLTYMLSAYVSKLTPVGTVVWNKLPYLNAYAAGDQLFAFMKKDTVTICYSSTSPWPSNVDSAMGCRIIVIPQQ